MVSNSHASIGWLSPLKNTCCKLALAEEEKNSRGRVGGRSGLGRMGNKRKFHCPPSSRPSCYSFPFSFCMRSLSSVITIASKLCFWLCLCECLNVYFSIFLYCRFTCRLIVILLRHVSELVLMQRAWCERVRLLKSPVRMNGWQLLDVVVCFKYVNLQRYNWATACFCVCLTYMTYYTEYRSLLVRLITIYSLQCLHFWMGIVWLKFKLLKFM